MLPSLTKNYTSNKGEIACAEIQEKSKTLLRNNYLHALEVFKAISQLFLHDCFQPFGLVNEHKITVQESVIDEKIKGLVRGRIKDTAPVKKSFRTSVSSDD